jgi:hypothetical protein
MLRLNRVRAQAIFTRVRDEGRDLPMIEVSGEVNNFLVSTIL